MLFRKEALDQVGHKLQGEVLLLPKLSYRLISFLLLAWTALAITLLFNGQFARKETVSGWLTPSSGVVRVFNPFPDSLISEIYVSSGQYVEKDETLLLLSNSTNLASGEDYTQSFLNQLENQRKSLNSRRERLFSEQKERAASLEKQKNLAEHDLKSLLKQLSTVSEHEKVMHEEVQKYRDLFDKGLIVFAQYNNSSKELLTIQSNKQSLERSKAQQEAEISSLEAKIELLPDEYNNKNADIDVESAKIELQLLQTKSQHEIVIKSPISGYITNLQAKVGQRILSSIPFLSVVPNDSELIGNLLVPVRSAGFLEKGQSVELRYSAFPYQKFGTHKATITKLPQSILLPNEIINSPVSINEAAYLVEAKLDSNKIIAYGREIELKNGMTLSAEMLLSERSLIEWFLEPLYSLTGKMQ